MADVTYKRKGFNPNSKGKPFKKGHTPWNIGKPRSEETKEKISNSKRGKPSSFKGKRHSVEARNKMSLVMKGKGHPHTIESRRKIGLSHKGEKSHFWKGGITPIHRKIRLTMEYKLWRESVFKRDNYTCIWCGQRGGRLNADHIKSFKDYPELRFAIDNGRTLCVECHKKTDNYGFKLLWRNRE
jgi:hypothetical protein